MALDRIHGRLISAFTTPELAFAIRFLEDQRTEQFEAGLDVHPNFEKILKNCRIELLTRNLNELPQSALDSCGYPAEGFAHD